MEQDQAVLVVKRANKIKAKIRAICRQMDEEGDGRVSTEVFQQVMKLNKV